jgi:hypothetical protein
MPSHLSFNKLVPRPACEERRQHVLNKVHSLVRRNPNNATKSIVKNHPAGFIRAYTRFTVQAGLMSRNGGCICSFALRAGTGRPRY